MSSTMSSNPSTFQCCFEGCQSDATAQFSGRKTKDQQMLTLHSCEAHLHEVNDEFRVAMGKRKSHGDYGRTLLSPKEKAEEAKYQAELNYAKNNAKNALKARDTSEVEASQNWLKQRHTELDFE